MDHKGTLPTGPLLNRTQFFVVRSKGEKVKIGIIEYTRSKLFYIWLKWNISSNK